MAAPKDGLEAKRTLGWLIGKLAEWARKKTWGEITIRVHDGQIVVITETVTHKDLGEG
jgi:hypothetical protein